MRARQDQTKKELLQKTGDKNKRVGTRKKGVLTRLFAVKWIVNETMARGVYAVKGQVHRQLMLSGETEITINRMIE